MLSWSQAYHNYEEQEKQNTETLLKMLIPTKNNDPPITPKIVRKQANAT